MVTSTDRFIDSSFIHSLLDWVIHWLVHWLRHWIQEPLKIWRISGILNGFISESILAGAKLHRIHHTHTIKYTILDFQAIWSKINESRNPLKIWEIWRISGILCRTAPRPLETISQLHLVYWVEMSDSWSKCI